MRVLNLRSDDVRPVLVAACVLLAMMAGHAMRETARDALFLSGLPAPRLPWAYLAIAVLALGIGASSRFLRRRFSHGTLLAGTLAVGAVADVGFWRLTATPSATTLFALYVWTGLLATVLTLQFWLHLAEVSDVEQAKRRFAPVAAGGLIGAVAGASGASLLLLDRPTHSLLLYSAALYAGTAALVALLPASRLAEDPGPREEPSQGLGALAEMFGVPYLRRLLTLAALLAFLGTGIDFVFKSGVAGAIPRERLGLFFARFQTAVNASALLFQLLLAPVLLRSLGVVRAIAVLPILLLGGTAATAATAGLLPILLVKGADGTLRHSLHRASTEILFLPLEGPVRAASKALVDSLGQRGGQALASVAILVATAMHAGERQIGGVLMVASGLALLSLIGLRREYVERFRERLRRSPPDASSEVPRLELHSLEVLVASLSSSHDADVLSAMDLLAAYGKAGLIPPLILHHPSRAVVLRAIELLAGSRHPHLDASLEQLLDHDDPEVRAAALRAYADRGAEASQILRRLHEDPSLAVRATALVVLLGRRRDSQQLERLEAEILDGHDQLARMALARVLPRLPYTAIARPARRLIADPHDEVPAELAQSLCANPRLEHLPLLIELLARRGARPAARAALVALGAPALRALAEAQRSAETPDAVRRHLPRTISRFEDPLAVDLLIEALEGDDPRLRYKALRGLGRMRASDPALSIPREPLERLAIRSLERAITMLYYRVVHGAWVELRTGAPPPEDDLLSRLLQEKQQRALERVFRVLHILEPEHEYALIFQAVRQGGAIGAGSREILENLVAGRLRDGLLAITDASDPREQLRDAAAFFEPDGAKHLLELVGDGRAPGALEADPRGQLGELARVFFASAVRDGDPILASVSRRCRERLEAAAEREACDGVA